jgi:hypothetical protein
MITRAATAVLLLGLALPACREPDGPGGPGAEGTRIFVTSSPQGAAIVLDDRDTGLRTPDTIAGLGGTHVLSIRLDSAGILYDYTVQISVPRTDSLLSLHGPLTAQCLPAELTQCYGRMHSYNEVAGLRFATHPLGGLFMRQGSAQGIFWPGTSANSYVSGGIPAIAGRVAAQAVSVGIFDHHYHAARPAPGRTTANGQLTLRQESWIVPPLGALRRFPTVRGIAVTQELIASDAVADVVLIRLKFRNITEQFDYQQLDPFLGAGGATYTDAYIGMLLDPDVGQPGDDWFTYDPALDMVYVYDARFDEPLFVGQASASPGLVGLRALRSPPGSTVIMNGWMSTGASADWRAGQTSEWFGLEMLSGMAPFSPAHPDRRIGHLPPSAGDARISISAGPLTLAPGDEAEIVLALAIAPPAPGTFQSGLLVQPGNPLDPQREIHRIAALLRERMQAAEALLDN